ncbi:response regulator transcription factor [Paenibacillus jilunlii]|uniref:DNA-binding response regulator, OmpR family, contains REC and winged-helix (WHTH) domain n=1 Tax=Paenibacillus jilunlii TaxID=682956 RepID=A0A1G9HPR3_9BACL|nr:response regulator transcription factor [Paenibacillus jilunlii]KWX69743.1 transcriptional regulator [Paenibacillus jilunlii]SDL14533.1 DNA-binding response regulator, OmpR family, contains REC and winged-helix (wHTH) domain [Paenibacillus jilunlii]
MKTQILIIDDEWNMRNLLRIYLQKEGFSTQEAATGQEALRMIGKQAFDLLLLDVMMPDTDGWQVCRAVREHTQIPILMLTARSETKDKVLGLGIGADDYLTKPFEPEELLARIHSLLRRSSLTRTVEPQEKQLNYPGLRILPDAREVHIEGQRVDFTLKEFDLLTMLARSSQRVFTRDELVERLWGNDYGGETRVIDTHIKNIREKLQKAGLPYNPVQTVWGLGYKFQVPGTCE